MNEQPATRTQSWTRPSMGSSPPTRSCQAATARNVCTSRPGRSTTTSQPTGPGSSFPRPSTMWWRSEALLSSGEENARQGRLVPRDRHARRQARTPTPASKSTEFIASRFGHDLARMNTEVGTPRRRSQMESPDRQRPARQVAFEPPEQDQPEHEQPATGHVRGAKHDERRPHAPTRRPGLRARGMGGRGLRAARP